MHHQDQKTLDTLLYWLSLGQPVWLCTVIATWGSSPRPIGAMMVISQGEISGSVSGGCVEEDILHKTHTLSAQTQVLRYDADNLVQLPCGGSLEILLEPVSSAQQDIFIQLHTLLTQGKRVQRQIQIPSGTMQLTETTQTPGVQKNASHYHITYGPCYRLLLIGAGETSIKLARLAQDLGFSVHVCDPRKEYRAQWCDEDGLLLDTMPDDAVMALSPDKHTAIVTLTHDPKLDDMALMEALKSDTLYVGALGSKATSHARKERLLSLDLHPEQVAKLDGPAGLAIGSKTPTEIAIAIAAKLISLSTFGAHT